jgi:hypothetical protein
MKVSKKDIQSINRNKSARKGRLYSTFDGKLYVGQDDGTLLPSKKSIKEKQQDAILEARVSTNESDIDILEDEDVAIRAEIKRTECKLIAMNIVLG